MSSPRVTCIQHIKDEFSAILIEPELKPMSLSDKDRSVNHEAVIHGMRIGQ